MNNEKIQKQLSFDMDSKSKSVDQLIGIWLSDQNRGFCLGLEGDSVKRFRFHREDVNQLIELKCSTWKRIITHELSMYEAMIAGKVNFHGDHWEVIQFFDQCKHLNLDW